MGGLKLTELLEPSLFYRETSICKPRTPFVFPFEDSLVEEQLGFSLEILNPNHTTSFDLPFQCLFPSLSPSPLDLFDTASDLIQIGRFQQRLETQLSLRSLSDRVTALELGFNRALTPKTDGGDRKYTWTTEIKEPKEDGFDRKYKWTAETKGGVEKNLKWTAEIKGKGKAAPISHRYLYQTKNDSAGGKKDEAEKVKKDVAEKVKKDVAEKVKKSKKGSEITTRVVKIEEQDKGAVAIRQVFAKRAVNRSKGKSKELSPQDAALVIQMSFRAHLVRRSKVLRGLRDLAVAKAKLKEIRSLFSNFSYRRRIATDAEECQRFSEKIIVLLLTVDAIEGSDYMVRAARRSMVDELEAMLEVVDPQPPGKLGSMKRRRFDLPDGGPIMKEMALGVEDVVHMLNHDVQSIV